MKGAIRIFIFMLAVLLAQTAGAVTLGWNNPTTYDDGTAIPSAYYDGAFVRVFSGASSTGPWTRFPNSTFTPQYPATSADIGVVPEGTWITATFVVKCDAAFPMQDGNKCESGFAVAIQYSTAPPPPPPPIGPPGNDQGKKSQPPGQLKFQ